MNENSRAAFQEWGNVALLLINEGGKWGKKAVLIKY